MNTVEINNLSKIFKSFKAVDSLSFNIEDGSLLALLGVNGAGKTTTIKMLSCLLKPTNGDANICGNSIKKNPQAVKEIISISPQESSVAGGLTVRENLMFICSIYGFDKKKAEEKCNQMLTDFGLTEYEHKKAKLLSGGNERRLSIAMALITEPKVLFLDEPTLGLDVLARRKLWQTIEDLKGKITIILTTHYLEEAERLADKIAVMAKGKLCAVGTADELIQKTRTQRFEDAFVALCEEV